MDQKHAMNYVRRYFAVAVFCGIFSVVYEHFSHGVYSDFMIRLFAIPLLGGVLPFLLIRIFSLPFPNRLSLNAYNSAVASIAVGCCMQGVFEIYGTVSSLIPYYFYAGAVFAFFGIMAYLLSTMKRRKRA